ncbi:ribosome maturation factor RimP [Streptococcaceae bacterium ESL0729]|nr:ribosome maturation factor RimP [Streptococcaceae bacterium ESL0729]
MLEIIDIVSNHITPLLPEPYELVDVEWEKLGADFVLRILIDKPGGIALQDTVDMTEIISPALDEIKPDPFPSEYMLEVASPGAERPLKKASDFEGAVGKYIFVSLYAKVDKEKEFVGDLVAFDGEKLTIDYLNKGQHKTVEIDVKNIAKARTSVKF